MNLIEHLRSFPADRIDQILVDRRTRAIEGAGAITKPAPEGQVRSFPFSDPGYPYGKALGSMLGPRWIAAGQQDPASLVPVDPYGSSRIKAGGLAVWDAAVGLPAAALRPPRILEPRELVPTRNCNKYWSEILSKSLGRVGRLGSPDTWVRPSDPYLVDLMAHPQGWKLKEAAHALAHLVQDRTLTKVRDPAAWGSTGTLEQRALANLAVSLVYGLPFDTWMAEDPGQYGVQINISGNFRNPSMLVPCMVDGCPVPDKTVAIVQVGVFMEPHPAGVTRSAATWHEINRFSCAPSMAVVAGWELVDVVTHQAVCTRSRLRPDAPLYYGMSVQDLEGPDTFWGVLAAGIGARGLPAVDQSRYWYVEEWLESQSYRDLLARTPPLPCSSCIRFNMRAEGAPKRPDGNPPEPQKGKRKEPTPEELEWAAWYESLEKAESLIRSATVFYETYLVSGRAECLRIRKARLRHHRERLAEFQRVRRIEREIKRAMKAGLPSKARSLSSQLTKPDSSSSQPGTGSPLKST